MTRLRSLLAVVLILPLAAFATSVQADATRVQVVEVDNEAVAFAVPAGPTQYNCIVLMGRLFCY